MLLGYCTLPMASSSAPIDSEDRDHDARNGQEQTVPLHHQQRRRKDSLTLVDLDPSRSSPSVEQDEDSENEEDPLPGSGEAPTSSLTVREAIEGLFSTHPMTRIGGSK